MITTPVRPVIAGEKVGERKLKEGEKPEETDDRGEKDAEEEREFAEVPIGIRMLQVASSSHMTTRMLQVASSHT